MNHHPISDLLKSFDNQEWKKFADYLESPFFNKRIQLIDFYKIIRTYYKKVGKTSFPSLEYLWEELKGNNTTYDEQQVRNLLTKLSREAEKFLAHHHYQKSEKKLHDSIELSAHRVLPHQFRYFERELQSRDKQKEVKTEQDYFAAYLYKKQMDIFYGKTKPKFKRQEHLQDMIVNLDYGYLIGKLKQHCFLLSKSRKHSHAPRFQLFKQYVKDYIEQLYENQIPLPPLLKIYYQILQTIEEKTSNNIEELSQLFQAHGGILEDRDQSNIRQTIINFYTLQISNGNTDYIKIQFEYCKELDNKNLLTNAKGKIEYRNYQNLTLNALLLAKIDPFLQKGCEEWAVVFIEKYRESIYPQEYTDNTYNYLLGRLFFYQKNWKEAENRAKHIIHSPVNTIYYLRSYTLLIRSLYEDDPTSSYILNMVNRLYDFVRRKEKLNNSIKKKYKNFASKSKSLFKLKNNKYKTSNYTRLKQNMEDCSHLVNKDWLLKKLEEIKIAKAQSL